MSIAEDLIKLSECVKDDYLESLKTALDELYVNSDKDKDSFLRLSEYIEGLNNSI